MPRILHIIPAYLPATKYGGPIRSVHGLCRGLVERGHSVVVFTTNRDGAGTLPVPLDREVDVDGVRVKYFQSSFLRRLYFSPEMKDVLEKNISQFDLVHLHSLYVWPTAVAARVTKRHSVPYIVSPRGMLIQDMIKRRNRWIKTGWIRWVDRKTLEESQGIHATSELERREIRRFRFHLPETFVVPNGIDCVPETGNRKLHQTAQRIRHEFWRKETDEKLYLSAISYQLSTINEPIVLFLGRISWKKGLDRLIQAIPYVSDAKFIIAGNDDENLTPKLRMLAERYRVEDRICFTGGYSEADREYLLNKAQLLVLPSYSENFGNVVLEAMQAGCPVIVSPEVGLAETVQETGSGVVVENEPKRLGKAIDDLLKDQDRLEEMKTVGPKVVVERFTWDIIARQMEQVYLKVIEKYKKEQRICI